MKVDKADIEYADTPSQHFFLGCWYNLSHDQSLDSERVSIINPKNGIEELVALYEFGEAYGGAGKRVLVATELAEVLKRDPILDSQEFASLRTELLKIMDKLVHPGISILDRKRELVLSIAKELLEQINTLYIDKGFKLLRESIESAVGPDNSQNQINEKTQVICNSIMSTLLSFGSNLPEVAGYYRHIMTKRSFPLNFWERFEKVVSVATKPAEEYKIKFDLVNPALSKLLETIVESGEEPSFSYGIFTICQVNNNLCKATTKIKAASPIIAGQKALEILEELVDIVSYTLGKEKVIIKRRYTVELENRPVKYFETNRPVPNPSYQFDKAKFQSFLQSLEILDISAHIKTPYNLESPPEATLNNMQAQRSNCKISAAFRLFRIGEASDNMEARFTSYWTSLESLTRDTHPEAIGDDGKVISAVLPCISADYVCKRLKSFLRALHHINILGYSIEDESFVLSGISTTEFYSILKDKRHSDALLDRLADFPYLKSRLSFFSEKCQSPELMGLSIDGHELKVSRQLMRLYRVRNVIVHQAGKVLNLELLCATLEHYLKICLNSIIDLMTHIPTIQSPEECFIRYQHLMTKAKVELNPLFEYSPGLKREKLAAKLRKAPPIYCDTTLLELIEIHK